MSLSLSEGKLIDLAPRYKTKQFKERFEAIPIEMSSLGLPYIEVQIGDRKCGLILDYGASELMLGRDKSKMLQLKNIRYPAGLIALDESGNKRKLGLAANLEVRVGEQYLVSNALLDDFVSLLQQVNVDDTVDVYDVIGTQLLAEMSGIIDFGQGSLYIRKGSWQ